MLKTVPIKELKNIAAFAELVENSHDPVIVTRNGYEAFAALSLEQLDALRMEAARGRLYQEMDKAENDVAAGNVVDARTSQEEARARYGL